MRRGQRRADRFRRIDISHTATKQPCWSFVGRLLDTFHKDASGVSAQQHFHRLVSPATFRPTEWLIGPPLFPPRAVLHGISAARDPGPPS